MRMSTPRTLGQLALLVLLLVTSLLAPAAYAQGPRPSPTPPPLPPGNGVSTGSVSVQSSNDAAPASASADAQAQAGVTATPVSDANGLSQPQGIQGLVQVDVAVPSTIVAGDIIDYTYTYTNTGSTAYTGLKIDTMWANFSTRVRGNVQYCETTGCDVLREPNSVKGPTVTQTGAPSDDARLASYARATFTIGTLGPKAVGAFTVRLRSRADMYPKSNQQPTRPSGSVLLTLPGGAKPISEDTANTMTVGPVLVANKTAGKDIKIYPGEQTVFTITVGNATGTGDMVNGQVRADARPANAIEIKDTFPEGSEFVSANGAATVDQTTRTVTWKVGLPLAVGATISRTVVFRKLDVNRDCGRLTNNRYSVTSRDYPMNGTTRYQVTGPGAAVLVVTPLVIPSVGASPSTVIYGADSTINFTVQNYWDKPITGLQVHYDVQSNAFFVPGSAGANVLSAPRGDATGGTVTWRVSMPAGNKLKPSFAAFQLKVRGGYTSEVAVGTGQARVTAPTGVPSACSVPRNGRPNLKPRLMLSKSADIENPNQNVIYVQRGQAFPYVLDVTNNGTTTATGVDVVDFLPTELGANFTYIPGSSTIDGVRRHPNTVQDGRAGSLTWDNLTIPAGRTLKIRYSLEVDGRDYYTYRNTATMSSGSEAIIYGRRNVTVKINPHVDVTKEGDGTTGNPNDLVQFTVTLTNREPIPYMLGLRDKLGDFIFERQLEGYAEPQRDGSLLEWPLVMVGPGETIQSTYLARIPSDCRSRDYVNEVLFHNEYDNIQPIPSVTARVKVTCGFIEYSMTSDRTAVSLLDRVVYTSQVLNAGATAASNVRVEDYLPRGFKFISMDPTSDVKTLPARTALSDGRTKMVWTIPSIASLATSRIKFIATSGDVVGPHEASMTVPTGGNCRGACSVDSAGISYAVRSVQVAPMITMEPTIKPEACFQPGNKLTYQLAIVNTNIHAYNATDIKVTLPLGLRFVRAIAPTTAVPAPAVTIDGNGITTVRWSNLVVPAKPSGSYAAQVIASMELEVGQVWGTLVTQVQTTSPDGAIPHKDGIVDPDVKVCSAQPSVALEASSRLVRVGTTFLYQVTLANTSAEPMTVALTDQLPANITYAGMVRGPSPTVSGSRLIWNSLAVPAATPDGPSVVVLQFRAKLVSGTVGATYGNTITANSASTPIDGTYRSVSIRVP